MNWFSIAFIGPVLYAVSNHIDKYILEKFVKGGEAGAIVVFSSLFSVITLPLIYIVEPGIFLLDFKKAFILSLNGTINIICLILYFKVLRDNDTSLVIPFYQTIPVFGFILGYFVLGEVLTVGQISSCLLIILGSIILSFDLTGKLITIRTKVVILMLLGSCLFAINGVVFKLIAVQEGFWVAAFWEFAGKVLIGVLFLFLLPSYRKGFLSLLKSGSFPVLLLISFNETIFLIADGATIYATLLAPITLVMAINGFQPVFVFAFGIILTMFFPKILRESLSKNILYQKISAIGIITAGTFILGYFQ